jgi:arylsulfatase A-like enzyme
MANGRCAVEIGKLEIVVSKNLSITANMLAILVSLHGTYCQAADTRPNVLMIAVDDMNDWVGCLGGHLDVQTPNIDRLAKRGTLFANAHCPAPVCNPSRVAVLSGKNPSNTGVYDNRVPWHEVLHHTPLIPQHFAISGYHVAGGGKIHHHMPGFNRREDWHQYFDQVFDSHYQDRLARGESLKTFAWPRGYPLNQLEEVKRLSNPPQNPTEFDWGAMDKDDQELGDGKMVGWAVDFLADPPSAPFFLAAGIYRPHLPWYAPRKYFDMYPLDQIKLPQIKEDDLDDLPEEALRMAADRRGDYNLVLRNGRHKEVVQAYLANISFADALVGQLLDALDASPVADNTIIVFWSDHGWHLGEKQHLHKFTLWERSTRVPFIVVAPELEHEGGRSAKPVGLIDLFPTLIELCGLEPVPDLDGTSLVPLLKDPEHPWERPALTTHGRANHSLRTERWRYIRYAVGGEELYDHQNDPHEWNNLASSPQHTVVQDELRKLLPIWDAAPAIPVKRAKKPIARNSRL